MSTLPQLATPAATVCLSSDSYRETIALKRLSVSPYSQQSLHRDLNVSRVGRATANQTPTEFIASNTAAQLLLVYPASCNFHGASPFLQYLNAAVRSPSDLLFVLSDVKHNTTVRPLRQDLMETSRWDLSAYRFCEIGRGNEETQFCRGVKYFAIAAIDRLRGGG